MFFIESLRLKLIPLPHFHLQILQKSRAELEKVLGLNISQQQTEPLFIQEIEDALVNFWLPRTAENPENYPWFTNWEIVLKTKNLSIGGIGLAGLPDEKGETMTGYGLDSNFRNQGFATEALLCLSAWAFEHASLKALIATTYPDNIPSQRVLIKAGFELMKVDELLHFRKINSNQLDS